MKIEVQQTTKGRITLGPKDIIELAEEVYDILTIPGNAQVFVTLADGTRQSISTTHPLTISYDQEDQVQAEGDPK